eukprot:2735041-Rhodomonas_salina.1
MVPRGGREGAVSYRRYLVLPSRLLSYALPAELTWSLVVCGTKTSNLRGTDVECGTGRWQTETGGHMITPMPGATPTKPGQSPMLLRALATNDRWYGGTGSAVLGWCCATANAVLRRQCSTKDRSVVLNKGYGATASACGTKQRAWRYRECGTKTVLKQGVWYLTKGMAVQGVRRCPCSAWCPSCSTPRATRSPPPSAP